MPSLLQRTSLALKIMTGIFSDSRFSRSLQLLQEVSPKSTPPRRGTPEFLKAYSTMPWLHGVIHRIATSVSAVEWALYSQKKEIRGQPKFVRNKVLQVASRKTRAKQFQLLRKAGELVEITTNPVLDVFHAPNPFHTSLSVRSLIQIYLDLTGESFLIKERGALNRIERLWPIPPHWITQFPTLDKPSFELQTNGIRTDIPDSEILYFLHPDPFNPYGRGVGMAQALTDELETDEYASKHCLDAQTECLTSRGWVNGLDVTKDDEIATWSEAKARIEYHKPMHITNTPYHGLMHRWKGRNVDFLVTPTHRMWVQSGYPVKNGIPHPWKFEESQAIADHPQRSVYFRDAGLYDGEEKTVHIPAYPWRNTSLSSGSFKPTRGVNDPLSFSSHEFAPFLGWFISEGCIRHSGGCIEISQMKPLYLDKIREAVGVFPDEWVTERIKTDKASGKPVYTWTINHYGLAEWLREQTGGQGSHHIHLPQGVFEWSAEVQRVLLTAMIDGDGMWRKSKQTLSVQYGTASEKLADDLQRLCIHIGWSSIKGERGHGGQKSFMVYMKGDAGLRHLNFRHGSWCKEESYHGRVWCVTVENETFFTRRNGRVMLSGNTKAFFYNSARPDLLIYPKGETETGARTRWDERERKRLELDWRSKVQGYLKSWTPYFIPQEIGVHEFSQNFRNLQLTQLREFQRDIILQIAGVPPEIMGVIENSNRATIDSAFYLFALLSLIPRLEFQRTGFQENLLPEFDERLILDYASPIDNDKEFQAKIVALAPWMLEQNEWRDLAGFDETDDGGELRVVSSGQSFTDDLEGLMEQRQEQAAALLNSRQGNDPANPPKKPNQNNEDDPIKEVERIVTLLDVENLNDAELWTLDSIMKKPRRGIRQEPIEGTKDVPSPATSSHQ